ncbi:MAG: efflux RND transporter periplasmic adaptor subunit [Porticoccaceae bacterium]|jgi:HlyD family secretion protein|nr:efflux RND transporter periplasmic adaptor subunit [Porticoccaceae bacterium]MBT4164170.1 efflux RND transporter periplasmic adaptor subunit [Porticoccaceae bacterium]MBT4210237.1 efflux RND transporter periplasmic adaptor subunit [Porticoccaceae bacterium]MBT4591028.1 efflux RND transporter periplasmic adaptor subunit [Porticoccaceae bacterium]MBT5003329.1 efflux RND transporter periplasmic adaptor subunit [Porticoccaceae bacterium]
MKKNLIIVGVVIALVAIAYFNQTGSSAVVSVNVEPAKIEEIKSSILASGTLIYKEQIELRSEVIGQVSEMLVEEGDQVSKDQVLMRLDPRTFNADVEQQQAYVRIQTIAIERQKQELKNITSKWERNKNLFERKMIGQDAFELVDNQYALARIDLRSREEALTQAQATLDKALERLEKTVFRSPIEGIATSVDIKLGETAISGTTNIAGSNLITVADPSSILVEVLVDEADIANIEINQSADVFAVAYPDQALKGTVQSIATSAKRSNYRQGLSFTVKILLEATADIDIRPGMSCRAEIFTNIKGDTIAVPIEAIVFEDVDNQSSGVDAEQDEDSISIGASSNLISTSHVFLLIDGKAVKRDVDLGISNDRLQEITFGLAVDDRVIIGPARALSKLEDGESVKANKKKAD